MASSTAFRDWMLGIVGTLAAAGILGSLKLYSDIQVHLASPMHEGADKRFDKLEARLGYIENEFKRNDDYNYMILQLLADKNKIFMPEPR